MRILMLGGTSFVGRAIAADVLERGHVLTLFTRGKTNPDLFPEAERLVGDRVSGDYRSLAGATWDAVIDVCGYVPRHVNQAADALADRVGRYVFISTGSVYDIARAAEGPHDNTAARLAPERGTEEVTGATYGALKVACEDDVMERFGSRSTIVRPGIVAGPHDPTDRFTYWVRRAQRGGRVALPGRAEQPIQVVDAADLARLTTAVIASGSTGAFDAVGPLNAVTMRELIEACAVAAGTQVEVFPVAPVEDEAPPPLVMPRASEDPLFLRSTAGAAEAGMPATPLEQTARIVIEWDADRGLPPLAHELLAPDVEEQLIGAAHSGH